MEEGAITCANSSVAGCLFTRGREQCQRCTMGDTPHSPTSDMQQCLQVLLSFGWEDNTKAIMAQWKDLWGFVPKSKQKALKIRCAQTEQGAGTTQRAAETKLQQSSRLVLHTPVELHGLSNASCNGLSGVIEKSEPDKNGRYAVRVIRDGKESILSIKEINLKAAKTFAAQTRVVLHGLNNASFNGLMGVTESSELDRNGRYKVRVQDGGNERVVMVKATNLIRQ
jgi:hypothetical protein